MRLGLDTEDKFLIKLNEINEQIQSTFLTEAKKMTEKNQLDMIGMMLGKHINGALDMDTMVIKTQERLMNSLERGIEYDGTV